MLERLADKPRRFSPPSGRLVRAEFLKTYPADSDKAKSMAFLRCEKLALVGDLMA